MHLYNLTLQRSSAITHAVHGSFSGTKTQEILIARGKSLDLLRPDQHTGKVHTLLTTEIFGVIRSMMTFRLIGGAKGELSTLIVFVIACVLILHPATHSSNLVMFAALVLKI